MSKSQDVEPMSSKYGYSYVEISGLLTMLATFSPRRLSLLEGWLNGGIKGFFFQSLSQNCGTSLGKLSIYAVTAD